MRVIIESFLIFILLLFISYTAIELIVANKQVGMAQSFHTACIDSIENSNYDSGVISKWQEKATKYGFIVNVINCSKLNIDEVIPCYYVSLTYRTKMNILGVKEESTIKGYAR